MLDEHLTVACGEGAIRILELQRAGKAPMKAAEFLARHAAEAAGAARLMPRYKLIIEYDGTPFSGWQIQENGPTVQGALEAAVKAICGEDVRVHGAGRTDAGVHALGQVAHCDIAKHFVPGRFRDGLNAHLRPHPIGVLSAEIVPTISRRGFPRRSATISIASSTTAPTSRSISAAPGACRARSMRRRCTRPRSACSASTISRPFAIPNARPSRRRRRSISSTSCSDGDEVRIVTSARSFLHSQVRSMVGSLVWVGEGRWSADDLAAALAARNRAACGPVAPPDGLYLVRVDY